MVAELGELIDVASHSPDKSSELRKHFRNIGGNFGQRARENIEIIVAIHFEVGKIKPVAAGSLFLSTLRKPSRFPRSIGSTVGTAVGIGVPEARKFVLLLKFRDLVGEALPGNPEDLD